MAKAEISTSNVLLIGKALRPSLKWRRFFATQEITGRCFIFCLASIFQGSAFAAINVRDSSSIQYQAEGKLDYFVGGASTPRFERQFQVSVSNSDWNIRITPSDVHGIDYYEVVHSGDSIYYYTAFSRPSPNANILNNGVAEIAHGDVPVERGMFASYIWLGLASSSYFHDITNQEIQPIWAKTPTEKKVKAHWQLWDGAPFLPKHVVYPQQLSYLQPPFDKGWNAGVFSDTSETNLGGLTIPLSFTYEYFTPKADGVKISDLESAFKVDVSVKSVWVPATVNVSPPITRGPTLVEEQRLPTLPQGRKLEYLSSNQAALPPRPEKSVVAQYNSLKSSLRITSAENPVSKVRIALFAWLFLSGGAFIFIVLWGRRKKNKQIRKVKNV